MEEFKLSALFFNGFKSQVGYRKTTNTELVARLYKLKLKLTL